MTQRSKRIKQARTREIGLFTVAGAIVTAVDYGILNLLSWVFGWPLVAANVVSASIANALGYVLNRKVVFDGKLYSERKTVLLYVLTVIVSIFIVQSSILYVFDNGLMQSIVKSIGVPADSVEFVAANASKVMAGVGAFLWNFVTQRRFVFKSVGAAKN